MNIGRSLVVVALVALTAACATKKPPEPPPARTEPPPVVEEDLSRDTTVIPGERVGPMKLDMSLQQLLTAMGEPVGSIASRIPAGRPALLYRYPHPEAAADGAILVLVREHDQTVYSVQLDAVETYQTREGVRVGSSEALVRASFGKPQSVQSLGNDGTKNYCYLNGLAVQMDAQGKVRSLTVFPGSDLRKICRTPQAQQ